LIGKAHTEGLKESGLTNIVLPDNNIDARLKMDFFRAMKAFVLVEGFVARILNHCFERVVIQQP
jgi:hypothetical protein